MTAAPVMTITDELLQELEHKSKCAQLKSQWQAADLEFFTEAANPATILALVEHIRSLTEQSDTVAVPRAVLGDIAQDADDSGARLLANRLRALLAGGAA